MPGDAGKILGVNRIEAVERPNVGEMAGALHDVVKAAAGGGQNRSDMGEGEARFFFNAAVPDGSTRHVDRPLAADEEPTVHQDAGGIRTRGDLLFGMMNFEFRHGFHGLGLRLRTAEAQGHLLPNGNHECAGQH